MTHKEKIQAAVVVGAGVGFVAVVGVAWFGLLRLGARKGWWGMGRSETTMYGESTRTRVAVDPDASNVRVTIDPW